MSEPVASSLSQEALAALLVPLGGVLLSGETIATTIELITTLAAEAIPGATGAGVTSVDSRGQRSVAASSMVVERADVLQYELGAGPCLAAWRDQVKVRIDDTSQDGRWPDWAAAVAEVGVRAVLSVPLVAAGTCVGAIKVYAAEAGVFDQRSEHLLELFARQAAILLTNAQTLADAHRINVQLTEALRTRDVIGQAKGILLAQGAADDTAAFAQLVRASQDTNTKLHELARTLVELVISSNAGQTPEEV